MDLRTALLLPGQGAYRPGVLSGRPDSATGELLASVDAVAAEFGRDKVAPLLTDADSPDGRQLAASNPFALQLAIYATALAHAAEVARNDPPDVVLGHSMGEIAAATHAGYFSIADGARLTAHRAHELEQQATGTGGMLALRMSDRRAHALIAAAELRSTTLSVVNGPRHVVVAGPEGDLGLLASVADTMRVPAIRLPAPYPFHNPALATVKPGFAAAIAAVEQRLPAALLYSPALQKLCDADTDIKAMLVAQLTRPIDFLAALRDLQSYGLETVIECGRAGLSDIIGSAIACTAETADHRLDAPMPDREAALPDPDQTHPDQRSSTAPSDGNILETLQQVYADRLGYPIEAMDPDADLEGDLGIDSLKRMEILGSLVDRFALQHVADDTRFALQPTLGGLAQLIAETSRNGPRPNDPTRPTERQEA